MRCSHLNKRNSNLSFVRTYGNLTEVMMDHKLASLGDAYINFVHSLALSCKKSAPSGAKVKGKMLAEALRRTGLREFLPSRMTRHKLSDAAEAILVYGWLQNFVTLEESILTMVNAEDITEGLSQLLEKSKKRIKFS